MTNSRILPACALALALLVFGQAGAQVQFQVPVTVANGPSSQVLTIGVSGDGPGGAVTDNTIGADTDTTLFGVFAEELAPPAPPAPFPFDARILTIPGRDPVFPTGLGTGVFSDFRGFDGFLQVDTFKIVIAGDNVDVNPTVLTWPAGLGAFGSAWVIQPQSGSEWAAVDMIAEDSLVLLAGVLQRNILVIKTGAGPAGPAFAIDPGFLNFGAVAVGETSAVQQVTVSNPSTTNPLDITVTPNPNYIIDPLIASIPAAGSELVSVRFTPTEPGAGGNIEIAHNAPASPYLLTIAAAGLDTSKYLTLSPDTIAAKDPLKGKFFKSAKRGKGLAPNWANLLEEVVVQGGFQPGAVAGDSAGGMVVGTSHMFLAGPGKWKVVKDSAKIRAWVRLTKWNFKKNEGKSYNALQKTLEDKTGKHDLLPVRGFDFTTDGKNKPLLKQLTKLVPKKQDSPLFAELVALKFNIAASQLGKTPVGFGELLFSRGGNPFDGLLVREISERADTMMTYYSAFPQVEFDSLYAAVYDINRAFLSAIDTVSFEVGSALVLRGVENTTTFLGPAPTPVPPIVLAATTNATEEEEDFEDSEYDEDAEGMPVAAKLYQNYPNPFNPSTTIAFRLREASIVTIGVFDMLGRRAATLVSGEEFDEGFQTVEFSADGLSSGVYFYRIDVQGLENAGARSVETLKMMLLK